jgi:hypothetical protein
MSTANATKKQPVAVGSTWSNVNMDFDNLMGKNNSKGPAPSMNQLKSTNTSPIKSPTTPGANVMSPTTNSNFAFNQTNNNNNFNQFNAFQ